MIILNNFESFDGMNRDYFKDKDIVILGNNDFSRPMLNTNGYANQEVFYTITTDDVIVGKMEDVKIALTCLDREHKKNNKRVNILEGYYYPETTSGTACIFQWENQIVEIAKKILLERFISVSLVSGWERSETSQILSLRIGDNLVEFETLNSIYLLEIPNAKYNFLEGIQS